MTRFTSFIYSIGILISVFCLALTVPSAAEGYYTNMNASVVVGQSNFTTLSTAVNASTLTGNSGGFIVVNGKLIVSDLTNNRVLIWNSIPTVNGASADVVIGQQNFTSNSANQGNAAPSANTLYYPHGLYSDGTRLFVVDNNNNRVLIFNQIPTTNNASADVVIGQTNFSNRGENQGGTCKANTLQRPDDVLIIGEKLLIDDYSNRRVLIFNHVPTVNNASSDVVIGQQNFTSCTDNQGGTVGANTTGLRTGLATDGTKLIMADGGGEGCPSGCNNRVLIFNQVPTTNNASADVVIGQPDFTSKLANQGGSSPAANTLYSPNYPFLDNKGRLYIAEYNNHRVLIYNQLPTVNNASADIVLGQSDFMTATSGTGANKFNNVFGVFVDSDKLFVSDRTNRRILIFTNTINSPRLGISSIGGVPLLSPNAAEQGRLRISGNLSVDGGLYNLWKLEASVNGGGYAPVTSLTNSVATNSTHDPGKTDTVSSTFSHDFEPWNFNGQPLGNGDKQDWIDNQSKMLFDYGYTLKLKGYTNNTDTNPVFFLSKPLTIISPTNTTPQGNATSAQLPTLSRTPTITFSVNSKQRNELKENLVHYEVWVKRIMNLESGIMNTELGIMNEEGEWTKYIDTIPIDYDIVRDYEDNLRKGTFDGNKDDGNGTYENNNLIVTFTKNSSEISVRKKGQSSKGLSLNTLNTGIYQLKLVAVDKANHPQDSDNEITVKIIGSPQVNNPKNLAITNEWFPLQINSISGIQTNGIINQDTTQTTFQTSTSNPTIQGIAFSGSIITLTITDSFSGEYRTYTTTAKDSTWTIAPQLYPNSFLDVSVESVEGKYNELPTLDIMVFEP